MRRKIPCSEPQDLVVRRHRFSPADGTPEWVASVNSMLISAISRSCSRKRRGYSHPRDVVLTESDTPVYWAPPIGCRNAIRGRLFTLSGNNRRVCEGTGIEDRSATGGTTRGFFVSRFECTESQEVEWTCRFLRAGGSHREDPGFAASAGPTATAKPPRCVSSRLASHVPIRGSEQASGSSGGRVFTVSSFNIPCPLPRTAAQ